MLFYLNHLINLLFTKTYLLMIFLFNFSLVQKIGDSYRGYCVSETELESILTFHKQQTQSVWGTRQSPSPAKPATRLMWKSQYVPYDGIPFVNAGTSHQLLRGSPAAVLYCERIHFILVGENWILIAEMNIKLKRKHSKYKPLLYVIKLCFNIWHWINNNSLV